MASTEPHRPLRWLFFTLLVRPVVLLLIGLNVRNAQKLPVEGPAVIVANHNSHLDTMVLMTLFPARLLPQLRPVAAADYFLSKGWLAWFALRIIGIIPIARGGGVRDPLAGSIDALKRGEILILFPEGSRGRPEERQSFKKGIAHLVKRAPDVPVVPVFLHGLGKALPKGESVLVPFFCDAFIGDPIRWTGSKEEVMQGLDDAMQALADQGQFPDWD